MRLDFLRDLPGWWPYGLGALIVALDLWTSGHVIIRKRDVRAAISWVGLIWLVPGLGALLYLIFGLNRIRTRASALQRERRRLQLATPTATAIARIGSDDTIALDYKPLARMAEQLSGRPLLRGNRIQPLHNGDEAYPEMLAAIDGARRSVGLASYIFGNDAAGLQFAEALARATKRGVAVRVLVDGAGVYYSWPPVHRVLKKMGVPTALFLPGLRDAGLAFFNLRNHRKVLTVDGRIAFAGGMNIQQRNVHASKPPLPVRDLHFRIEGPIVAQLQEAFAEDWAFTTREVLDGPAWHPTLVPAGDTTARCFTDGPDGGLEILRSLLMGAIASARESVRIVTPYFLPDQATIAALAVAALRGIRVEIVLPERGNIPMVEWAATAQLWQVLQPGCRIYYTPRPFDHSKLMVVDRQWVLFGSSNWDARSLRLNFELDVECYDPALAKEMDDMITARIQAGRRVMLADVDARSLPRKLRDGAARLMAPYL